MQWTEFYDPNASVFEFNDSYSDRRLFILIYNGRAFTANCNHEGHILNFDDFLSLFHNSQINLVAQSDGTNFSYGDDLERLFNYDDFLIEEVLEKTKKSCIKA